MLSQTNSEWMNETVVIQVTSDELTWLLAFALVYINGKAVDEMFNGTSYWVCINHIWKKGKILHSSCQGDDEEGEEKYVEATTTKW